jgi:hypothetical protein
MSQSVTVAEGEGAPPGSRLAIGLVFLACLAPVFTTPVMPLIDFYDHLARYFVLSNLGHDPVLARNYASAWGLLPNLGVDVIGTALMRVFDPLLVGRVIAVLLLAVQFSGVLALNKALFARTSLMTAALSGMLLYSYIFIWGFSNFLLGLGLAFLAAAWWDRMRDRPLIAVPTSAALSVLIFFAHGFAFFLYGLLVGGLELGRCLETAERKVSRLIRQGGLLLIQAVAPVLLFLHTRTATEPTPAQGSPHPPGVLPRLAWEARHRLHAIVQVANGPSFAFDLVLGLTALAAVVIMLRRGDVRLSRRALPALAIFGALVFLIPPAVIGVDYLGDRLPLVFAMLAAAAVAPGPTNSARTTGFWLGLLAVRTAAVCVWWAPYGKAVDDYRAVTSSIRPGDLVQGFVLAGQDPRSADARCEMFRPLVVIERRAGVPLFAYGTQQPLTLTGPLAWAATHQPPFMKRDDVDAVAVRRASIARAAVESRFDYILVCGRSRLNRPLPGNLAPVASRGELALYQVRKASDQMSGARNASVAARPGRAADPAAVGDRSGRGQADALPDMMTPMS